MLCIMCIQPCFFFSFFCFLSLTLTNADIGDAARKTELRFCASSLKNLTILRPINTNGQSVAWAKSKKYLSRKSASRDVSMIGFE